MDINNLEIKIKDEDENYNNLQEQFNNDIQVLENKTQEIKLKINYDDLTSNNETLKNSAIK